ncbi:MAG TPA: hypothetical protein PKD72_02635 [Gemmatales bacterium]|nr:hypothetical protein [Gemmatales bacterium]
MSSEVTSKPSPWLTQKWFTHRRIVVLFGSLAVLGSILAWMGYPLGLPVVALAGLGLILAR